MKNKKLIKKAISIKISPCESGEYITGFNGLENAKCKGWVEISNLTDHDKVVEHLKVAIKGKINTDINLLTMDDSWPFLTYNHLKVSKYLIQPPRKRADAEASPVNIEEGKLFYVQSVILRAKGTIKIPFLMTLPILELPPRINVFTAKGGFMAAVSYNVYVHAETLNLNSPSSPRASDVKLSYPLPSFSYYDKTVVSRVLENGDEPFQWVGGEIRSRDISDTKTASIKKSLKASIKRMSLFLTKKKSMSISGNIPRFPPTIPSSQSIRTLLEESNSAPNYSSIFSCANPSTSKIPYEYIVSLEKRFFSPGDSIKISFKSESMSANCRRFNRIKLSLYEEWSDLQKETKCIKELITWETKEEINGEFWKLQSFFLPIPNEINPSMSEVDDILSYISHRIKITLYFENGEFEELRTPVVMLSWSMEKNHLDEILKAHPTILSLPLYKGDCSEAQTGLPPAYSTIKVVNL